MLVASGIAALMMVLATSDAALSETVQRSGRLLDLVDLPARDVRGTLTRGKTLAGTIPVIDGEILPKSLVFRFPGYLEPSVAGDQARASFDLGGGFTRLRFYPGINDVGWRGDIGSVPIVDGPPPWIPAIPGSPERQCKYQIDFRVVADRREVLRTGFLTPADPADLIEVDVTDVKTLTLVNVVGSTEACADWYAVWGDPVVTTGDSATPPGADVDYFALGDSIASGHGLMDDQTRCRRSLRAYPHRVRDRLDARFGKVRFVFRACSGARAGVPSRLGSQSLDYQVDVTLSRLSSRPTVVSLTIGANDLGWSDVELMLLRLHVDTWDEFTAFVDSQTKRVETFVAQEVGRLLRRPNVTVVVTTYFNPFNKKSVFCLFGTNLAPRFDCYARTEYAITKLNRALLEASRRFKATKRVTLVDLRGRFGSHSSPRKTCGLAPPEVGQTWIQYRTDPASNSNPLSYAEPKGRVGMLLTELARQGAWRGDCFHPNRRGSGVIGNVVAKAAIELLG